VAATAVDSVVVIIENRICTIVAVQGVVALAAIDSVAAI